jgi:hypothetical protein
MRLQDIINFETFVTTVSFSDDSIEVTFLEKREQGESVMMARVMAISIDDEESMEMYADIQNVLRELIERGYITLRNPPEEFEEKPTNTKSWAHQQMVGE